MRDSDALPNWLVLVTFIIIMSGLVVGCHLVFSQPKYIQHDPEDVISTPD